ncbi:bifunctional phosphopantothenoylcysteine decarboxylase/phosphopantothenate--cysteine ligase CoaBC [[Acholeplasma] multilocale]|uniref:bifunctional phosphopantothenoylcysteine decarboxylase/phosphopantothenate--cysteine ligase CoaBC n=1 Tax=[Acholeplasma] multilocale TaxID=264638 RepID=UPI00047D3635|nr:bifunctional phosphopantothenoylcysteine decarboxylase/phosphopantothenate--cysteine ligase CoaBC [[Acholeplasma] multilocale]
MQSRKINLIITGGIGATKSMQLYSLLNQKYDVNVIVTKSGAKFIDEQIPVKDHNIFDHDKYDAHTYGEHIKLTNEADITIVYPATYNIIGKVANGIADDFASLLLAAFPKPIIYFPSMNENMYNNDVMKRNKDIITNSNMNIWYEPKVGRLASGHIGIGRLPEPNEAFEFVTSTLFNFDNLYDKRILINLGRTRSYIDNVRYITNGSSGKMGSSLINIAKTFTNNISIVKGDTDVYVSNAIPVITNQEMFEEMKMQFANSDIVICTAALYDFEVSKKLNHKISKEDGLDLEFTKSIDVLEELGKMKTNQTLVGFSLADDYDLEKAYAKMKRKNMDVLILNQISAMGNDNNEIIILNSKDSTTKKIDSSSKQNIAFEIWKYLNEYKK